MPELRKDPVVNRWVIIAKERARRPGNVIDRQAAEVVDSGQSCIYCAEDKNAIYSKDGIQVIPIRDPLLTDTKEWHPKNFGLYRVIDGTGHHEVVVEAKDHVANMADLDVQQISNVLQVYTERISGLLKDSPYSYFVIYKNYGISAGSRPIAHARSHVVALPIVPLRAQEKIKGAGQYYTKHQCCVYCDLIKQEENCASRVIAQTEHFIAVIPFATRFIFEIQLYPKKHGCHFHEMDLGQTKELAGIIKTILWKIKIGLDDCAYNFIIHSAPVLRGDMDGRQESLSESYHWHIEIMPRLTRIAGFEKGTGFYICSIPPEDMAEYLNGIKL